ncbi:hypothetical protein [Microbacterium halotolerans]|uniref:hypothetical protein n=1 Tax=Microbacterium halotolerans TaxID=246613 RepID=UPI000E6AA995|nr:hypothetical protein [Microbacterium halotolerans]
MEMSVSDAPGLDELGIGFMALATGYGASIVYDGAARVARRVRECPRRGHGPVLIDARIVP